mmetsp:Transcript_35067/g.70110  ORF Transcript_35067/g.70110 Transcript_35067/m.70110 type:complete len:152 (+) Transcript_35067:948-1403(+)
MQRLRRFRVVSTRRILSMHTTTHLILAWQECPLSFHLALVHLKKELMYKHAKLAQAFLPYDDLAQFALQGPHNQAVFLRTMVDGVQKVQVVHDRFIDEMEIKVAYLYQDSLTKRDSASQTTSSSALLVNPWNNAYSTPKTSSPPSSMASAS